MYRYNDANVLWFYVKKSASLFVLRVLLHIEVRMCIVACRKTSNCVVLRNRKQKGIFGMYKQICLGTVSLASLLL